MTNVKQAMGLGLLAILLVGSGCQKSIVFHVANANEDAYGVDVKLGNDDLRRLGIVAPGQRGRLTVKVNEGSLPIRGTIKADAMSTDFVVKDYANLKQIDQYFLIDGAAIEGPSTVPYVIDEDEPTGGNGDGGGDAKGAVTPPPPPRDDTYKKILSQLTAEQKQTVIYDACMNIAKLTLVSREVIDVDGSEEDSSVVGDAVKTKLVELGFNVPAGVQTLNHEPTAKAVRNFAADTGHSLAVLITAQSKLDDTFAKAHRYKTTIKGKVINLRTGRIIATKTMSAKGERLAEKSEAGESAAKAAAKKMVAYLTDEVCRKWQEATLVRIGVRVSNVNTARKVIQIHEALKKKRGVYHVIVDSWDESDQTVDMELLVRLSEKDAVRGYVENLRSKGVDIKSLGQQGEAIDAWRKAGK